MAAEFGMSRLSSNKVTALMNARLVLLGERDLFITQSVDLWRKGSIGDHGLELPSLYKLGRFSGYESDEASFRFQAYLVSGQIEESYKASWAGLIDPNQATVVDRIFSLFMQIAPTDKDELLRRIRKSLPTMSSSSLSRFVAIWMARHKVTTDELRLRLNQTVPLAMFDRIYGIAVGEVLNPQESDLLYLGSLFPELSLEKLKDIMYGRLTYQEYQDDLDGLCSLENSPAGAAWLPLG